MNYRRETTRLDFSSVFRKRRTKTTCAGAILTNFNNSRSIFWLQFLWENFYLEGFSNRGRRGFSKSRKIICFFWLQAIPCTLTPLPATSAKHQWDFHWVLRWWTCSPLRGKRRKADSIRPDGEEVELEKRPVSPAVWWARTDGWAIPTSVGCFSLQAIYSSRWAF